jgi:fatty acid desaturase
MQPAEYIVVTLNLVAGLSFAVPLSRLFSRLNKEPPRVFRYFAIFIGIYFLGCVAIVSMMLVPVLSIGLAFVWGILFRFVAPGPHIATQSP